MPTQKFAERTGTRQQRANRKLEDGLDSLFDKLYSKPICDGKDGYGEEMMVVLSVGSMANHPRDRLEELVSGYATRSAKSKAGSHPRRVVFPSKTIAELLRDMGLKNVYWQVADQIREDVDSIVEGLPKPKSRDGR